MEWSQINDKKSEEELRVRGPALNEQLNANLRVLDGEAIWYGERRDMTRALKAGFKQI